MCRPVVCETIVEEPNPRRLRRTVRGLIMPGERAWFEERMSIWYRGWIFQKALLTEEFNFERFQASCPDGGLPAAVLKADGRIEPRSPEQPIKPKPGDVVI